MNAFGDEKRKNGGLRRGFLPVWVWTLVIGFVLGMMVMALLRPRHVEMIPYTNYPIYMTATYLVDRATQTAQAEKTATQAAAQGNIIFPTEQPENSEIDPIYLTATYIIDRATQTQQAIATLTAYPTAIPYF